MHCSLLAMSCVTLTLLRVGCSAQFFIHHVQRAACDGGSKCFIVAKGAPMSVSARVVLVADGKMLSRWLLRKARLQVFISARSQVPRNYIQLLPIC
jgi:hypothetical protein